MAESRARARARHSARWSRRRAGKPPVREVASADAVPVGGAVTFAYPEPHEPCVLVRTAQDRFVAYSQKCTHLSCAVVPVVPESCLHCPCHQGFFDLETGSPTAGPPRRPLPRITLEVRNGRIYATGVEVRA